MAITQASATRAKPNRRWISLSLGTLLALELAALGSLWIGLGIFASLTNTVVVAFTIVVASLGIAFYRRRFRFGVVTMLIMVTALAIMLGAYASFLNHPAFRQRRGIDTIVYSGGDVKFNSTRENVSYGWLAKLIGGENFESVQSVRMPAKASDNYLTHLKAFSDLRSLDLSFSAVSDQGLVHLEGLENLESLKLRDCNISDEGLAYTARLTRLDNLSLQGTQVTDAGLIHLGSLTRLRWVNLAGTRVTDAGLAHLREFKSLDSLVLDPGQLTDVACNHISCMQKITSLWLEGKKDAKASVNKLPNVKLLGLEGAQQIEFRSQSVPNLTNLILSGVSPQVTDAALRHLKNCRKLERLQFRTGWLLDGRVNTNITTNITDAKLRHLAGLEHLKLLTLDGSQITDVGLMHIKNLTSLEHLFLDDTQISDVGLEHLKGLTNLKRLHISKTSVTKSGVERLKRALESTEIRYP